MQGGILYGHIQAGTGGGAKLSDTPALAPAAAASAGIADTASRSDHVHPLQENITGNAGTATKLATARTVTLTGAVTGSGSFNGGADVSITTTSNHTHSEYLPINTTTTTPTGTTRYNCEGYLYATKVYGAVWNDYAEYRACDRALIPGMVVVPDGMDDKVCLCGKRRAAGARVVTDTFGFAIGKTGETDVPVAVSGRVLAHSDEPVTNLRVGDAVCAGKHGGISRMRRWEVVLFPDRILGVVSHVPKETAWHGIPVNGRVWIELR